MRLKIYVLLFIVCFTQNSYSQFIASCDSILYKGYKTVYNEYHKNPGQNRFKFIKDSIVFYSDFTYKKITWVCNTKSCMDRKNGDVKIGKWQIKANVITILNQTEEIEIEYSIIGKKLKEKSWTNHNEFKGTPTQPILLVKSIPPITKFKREKACY